MVRMYGTCTTKQKCDLMWRTLANARCGTYIYYVKNNAVFPSELLEFKSYQIAKRCRSSLRVAQNDQNPTFLWQATFFTKKAEITEIQPIIQHKERERDLSAA